MKTDAGMECVTCRTRVMSNVMLYCKCGIATNDTKTAPDNLKGAEWVGDDFKGNN